MRFEYLHVYCYVAVSIVSTPEDVAVASRCLINREGLVVGIITHVSLKKTKEQCHSKVV